MNTLIEVRDLAKTFTLHQQHGVSLQVLRGLNFTVAAGECLVLHGQSGAGKSTLLRTLYGNYLPAGGSIRIRHAGDWLELENENEIANITFIRKDSVDAVLRVSYGK